MLKLIESNSLTTVTTFGLIAFACLEFFQNTCTDLVQEIRCCNSSVLIRRVVPYLETSTLHVNNHAVAYIPVHATSIYMEIHVRSTLA